MITTAEEMARITIRQDISKGSIMTKGGKTTKQLSKKQVAEIMAQVEDGTYLGEANIIIEYTNDKKATQLANKFKNLAKNPGFKLNVTFKRIENENSN